MFAPAEVFQNENINVTMNEAFVNESQSVVVQVEERNQVTEEEEGGMDDTVKVFFFVGINFRGLVKIYKFVDFVFVPKIKFVDFIFST